MPWQLIYTSAPRTLVAGQSGYGTVARSRDLREALVQRLEQISYYAHEAVKSEPVERRPVICAYRVLDFRGSRYHVLTRLQDAGLDFSRRTNHLAQHLVFEPAELAALPPPTIILAQWDGWRTAWQEEPGWLDPVGNLSGLPRCLRLPAATWGELAGDAGKAAALLERRYLSACTLVCAGSDQPKMLSLLAESLQLLDPAGRHPVRLWEHTFTSCLQAEDNPADFQLRGCIEGSLAWKAAQRNSDELIPIRELVAPSNALANLARQGPPKPAPPPPKPAPSWLPTPGRGEASPQVDASAPIPPPRELRGYDPSMYSEPTTGPRTRLARSFVLDLSSPRVWVPGLALFLALAALIAGFAWPGFLKSHLRAPDHGVSTQASMNAPENPTLLPDVTLPGGGAAGKKQPIESNSSDQLPPKPTPAPTPPQPTKEALTQLTAQLDSLPTCLVVLEGQAPARLPEFDEMEELLGKLFRADVALSPDVFECRLADGAIDLAPGAGTRTDLRVEQNRPKKLSAQLRSGSGFEIDCNEWYDARAGHGLWFHLTSPPQGGALNTVFKSTEGTPGFRPFRLVALADTAVAPIRLSKSLVAVGQTNFEGSQCPALFAWVHSLRVVPTNAHWQLRASTASSAAADLLELIWKEAPAFYPGPDHELDFIAIRSQVDVPLAKDQAKSNRAEREALRLQRSLQDEGGIGKAQWGQSNELASLASYAKAHQRSIDRETYLDYLRELPGLAPMLPPSGAGDERVRDALTSLRDNPPDPGARAKWHNLPRNYFLRVWTTLAELERNESDRKAAAKSAERYERLLNLIPVDLAGTPRISLCLVTGGKRYEILRFEGP